MFKNKKGFTLIELLAVIVILAILMLVAGANVFGILDEARKGSFRTEFLELLNAAQTKAQVDIMNGVIEGTGPNNTRCYSIADLATYFDNKNNYEGSVKVTYTNGQLTIKGFMAGNQHMVNNKDDTLETTDVLAVTETGTENINTCAEVNSLCKAVDTYSLDVGTAYNCEVSNGVYETFYILNKSGSKVNLILNRNLVTETPWFDWYNNRNICGPQTAYEKLANATSSWTNIPPIQFDNWHDPNSAEIVIKANNGTIRIESLDADYGMCGSNPALCTLSCDVKDYHNMVARLPFKEELNAVAGYSFVGSNLPDGYDYWTNNIFTDIYSVYTYRGKNDASPSNGTIVGIRPVITVNESDLK